MSSEATAAARISIGRDTSAYPSDKRTRAVVAAGVVCAVFLVEVLLRIWISPPLVVAVPDENWRPQLLPATITIKQVSEGIAESHFAADGRRSTGKELVSSGVENIVLLGDSYVEGTQVSDEETIGARIEQIASKLGRNVQVYQYGWSGAAPPLYIHMAAQIEELHPSKVAMVLNPTDLTNSEFFGGRFWRFDNNLNVVANPDRRTRMTPVLSVLKRSVLFSESFVRAQQLLTPAAVGASGGKFEATAIGEMVRQAKAAYGNKLVIVYLAEKESVRGQERELESQAAAQGVRLVNIRYAQEKDSLRWRGFANTMLGEGHLNAHGTSGLARMLWEGMQ